MNNSRYACVFSVGNMSKKTKYPLDCAPLQGVCLDSKIKRQATTLDSLIGLQIRKIRKSRNLTQASIAEMLKMSYQQIQKYERGQNRISASTLFCIATVLDHPVEDFFKLVDEYVKN